ncbi:unnamed protein product, partial [Ectocarpus fasciculatus]
FITAFQFKDQETVWIGTFNTGIYRTSGSSSVNYNTSNSPLPDDRINDLFVDHLDRLWMATDNGFAMLHEEAWEVYTMDNTPLLMPRISQIVVNGSDEIMIGNGNASEGGVLHRTKDGGWKNYTSENSLLPCNLILDIELEGDDVFWVSTAQLLGIGGVAKIENASITQVFNIEETGLLYNWIDNIEISNNALWVGFEVPIYNESGIAEGGIQRIDPQSTNGVNTYFPNSTGLTSNRIRAMKLHSDNSLWFTTTFDDPACDNCVGGIGVLFENEKFLVSSSVNTDLPLNAFMPVLNEDNNGNMYVASELSLYKLEIGEP